MTSDQKEELRAEMKVLREGIGTDELWTPEQVLKLVGLVRLDTRATESKKAGRRGRSRP